MVATSELREEASLWREQSARWLDIGNAVDGMRFDEQTGGIFTPVFVPAYHLVVDMVVARCAEAHDRLREVEFALEQIAASYEEEEARNSARVRRALSASP
jgi:hypothetical protein